MNKFPKTPEAVLAELRGLHTLLDSLGTYIFTKDTQGRYTYVNSHVCTLFQLPAEAIVGRDDNAFFDLKMLDELLQNDRQVLDSGQTVMREESNVIRETGETRIYWTVKTPIRDEAGNIIGLSGISTDITERKLLERQLQKQRQLLDTVLNNIDAYVYMKDSERHFLYVNNKVAELFGHVPQEIIGKLDSEVIPQEIADQFWELDKLVFDTKAPHTGEEIFTQNDGSISYYWSKKVPITWLDNQRALIGFSTDITELYLLREKLRKQAQTDALTGVNNRRRFFELAQKEFKRSLRYATPLTVMMIDIDHFKSVNDTYGHQIGDRTLKKIASIIKRSLRSSDAMGRIGGEEFAVFLPQTQGSDGARFAERLRAKIAQAPLPVASQHTLALSVSIGVSELMPGDEKFQQLLHRADQGLYLAKSGGRNRVKFVDSN